MNKLISLCSIKRLLEYRPVSTRITAEGKDVPKRKNVENRITLIGTDNSVSITDLRNAENLSMRRELKLVKIQDVDAKTRRPIYKLMTNVEYHAEELQKRAERQEARQKSAIKGQKLLSLSSKIGEHDLMTSVKKMLKLLEKQYEVKVIVSVDGQEGEQHSERIYSVIEKTVKTSGKIVQKRNKGSSLRFQLLPLRELSTQSEDNTGSKDNNDKGPM